MKSTDVPTTAPASVESLNGALAAGGKSFQFEELCDRIHEAVQSHLAELARQIATKQPHVQSRPGRAASNKSFPWFFSYRAFTLAGADAFDPVVLGVSVDFRDDQVLIRSDVSREDSGEMLLDCGNLEAPVQSMADVSALAGKAAEKLTRQGASLLTSSHLWAEKTS